MTVVKYLQKNLSVTHYRNGDPIPQVTDPIEWVNLTTGAWCYYNNDYTNEEKYGKLYNWYAVKDPRGLAPQGHHVPTDAEWDSLGVDAVYGGYRNDDGAFNYIGLNGFWWSSTENDTSNAWLRNLDYDYNGVNRFNLTKSLGFSVRCVRDLEIQTEISEKITLEFAEWMVSGVSYVDDTERGRVYDYKHKVYTTKELFEEFLKTKQ